ncbi:MAG: hypothetical protein ACK42E_04165, partial [Candidatus Bipolaricaulaceae bacterium]
GVGIDPCFGCTVGRDVVVQVFWRSSPVENWNWRFLTLRNETPEAGPAGYRVRGELPLHIFAPELWVLVRRFVLCDPWVNFGSDSARLWRPLPPPVVTPPAPPVETPVSPPPALPPAPPVARCAVGPLWSCQPGSPPAECLPPEDLDVAIRTELPETMGPGDAATLAFGHYQGSLAEGDWQDWYRFSLAKGQAALVYFEPTGNLLVDLYLVHDPCGTDLAVCLNVSGPTVIEAPCAENLQCVTIPDGLTECFTGPRCGFFLRIVHRAGSGSYKFSILPAEPRPL